MLDSRPLIERLAEFGEWPQSYFFRDTLIAEIGIDDARALTTTGSGRLVVEMYLDARRVDASGLTKLTLLVLRDDTGTVGIVQARCTTDGSYEWSWDLGLER